MRSAAALGALCRVTRLESMPGAWVKHAAQGAAVLADGLAGGRYAAAGRAAATAGGGGDGAGLAAPSEGGGCSRPLYSLIVSRTRSSTTSSSSGCRPSGFGQPELDAGEPRRQPVARRGQVAAHVDAGRQEVRHQYDSASAARRAPRPGLVDVRLGQLQERRLDHGMAAPPQAIGDVVQVGVGLRLAAAVRDQEQCGFHDD